MSIADDDAPGALTVQFAQAAYSVAESDDPTTAEVAENQVVVTVTLSDDPEQTVAIPLVAAAQDGAVAGDYSGVPATVTFDSGDTEATFTFTAVHDAVDDDGESVRVAFGALPTTPVVVTAGTVAETTVSIADDDAPGALTVQFAQAAYSVAESDDPTTAEVAENQVVVTVTLSDDPEQTVAIPLVAAAQDGAVAGDYSGVPATVTFDSGDTEATFTFTAVHDAVDDDGESVRVAFGALPTTPVVVTAGTVAETTVSIADDDAPGALTVQFAQAAYSVAESDDPTTAEVAENQVVVTVTLSDDPEQTVAIPLVAAAQDGAVAGDYSGVPATVTFDSGDTEATFTFTAVHDAVDDDGESVRVAFGALPTTPVVVTAGTVAETTVSIADDDAPGALTVQFAQAAYSVAESDDPTTAEVAENQVVVTVTLSDDPEQTVAIPLVAAAQDGAVAGDYSGVPATVTFDSGDTEATFTFTAVHDAVDDDGESVRVAFGALPTTPVVVTAGTVAETTVSIADDDAPGALTVQFAQAAYSVAESDDPTTAEVAENQVVVTVTLSDDPEQTVAIPLVAAAQDGAVAGDYSGVPATVTFDSGDTEATFTFTAVHDAVDDDGESVRVAFGALPTTPVVVTAGTVAETTVSIADDDAPGALTVQFAQAAYSVAESDDPTTAEVAENQVVVTVTLSDDPEQTVAIPLVAAAQDGAVAGDYSGVPATVTFDSGDTEATFTFTAVHDAVDDDGESVRVAFGALPTTPVVVTAGTVAETTVSIADDDAPGALTVQFAQAAYSVAESDDPTTAEVAENQVVVTVTLSDDPEQTVAIPLVAAAQDGAVAGDYSGVPATVTFDSGDTEATFTFTAVHDAVDDDGESVRVAFGALPTTPVVVTAGTVAETTVSIADDDAPGALTVQFAQAAYSVAESDDPTTAEVAENQVVVTVTLSDDPEQTVAIPLVAAAQDGAVAGDYSGVPATVTFDSGDTEATFTFTAVHDAVDDDGESVRVAFGALPTTPVVVTAGTVAETTVSIADDDAPGALTVQFAQAAYSVAESDDPTTAEVAENQVVVTVTLSDDPEQTVAIPLVAAAQDGAVAGDYSGVPATVTFDSGDTEATFTFTAVHDAVDDDGESVRVAFGALPTTPVVVTAGTVAETTVSIADDDAPGALTVQFAQAAYSVAESDDPTTAEVAENQVVVTVTLSDDPEQTVAIPLVAAAQDGAVAGDYSGVPATVTFDSGDTEATFTFTAVHDAVDDDGESVRVAFGALPTTPVVVTAGTVAETTVSIADDDAPGALTVQFAQAAYSVAESDDPTTAEVAENQVVVTVTLSDDPEQTVAIPLVAAAQDGAVAGDYSGVPATVTFDSGDTEATFTFTAVHDAVDDDGESVRVAFGALPTTPVVVTAGTVAETTVSIADDDAPGALTVQFAQAAYSVAESDDPTTAEVAENQVVVTVTLSDDPEQTVAIPLVAAAQDGAVAGDYSGVPATVTFDSGDTEATFTFTAVHDAVDDDGESVRVAFGALPTTPVVVTAGTVAETTVSIADDDAPGALTVQFAQAAYSVAESDDPTTAEVAENQVVVTVTLSDDPEQTVAIPLVAAAQDGAVAGDYSGVPATVTFDSGDTEATFTFTAVHDAVDDDGESVRVAFGALPTTPVVVTAGTVAETTVSIADDDAPGALTVQFAQAAYSVAESDDPTTAEVAENQVVVTVTLSDDPEQTVAIPLVAAAQDGAVAGDYSGVPATVTFDSGDTEATFTFHRGP